MSYLLQFTPDQAVGATWTHLALYKHGHVHEHVVQLLDGGLQLDDVGVPGFDVGEGLLGLGSVHHDALREDSRIALMKKQTYEA